MKTLAVEDRSDPPLAVERAGNRRCRACLAALRAAALLALALLLAGEPVAAVQGGKALALVIGNGTYREDRRLDHPTSIHDARLLAEALRKSGFTVREGRDLDGRRFLDALESFGRRLEAAGPGAVALFFYSGRAVRREGINYFLPIDVGPPPPGGLPAAAIHSRRVIEHLTRANVRVLLIIVDAAWKGAEGPDGPGLAPLYGPPGTLIFLSTEPGQLAASAAGRVHGVFARSLADALEIDGMSVERMAREVRTEVMAVTNGRQVPWSASSLMGENFYFGSAMRTVGTLFWNV